MDNIVRAHLTSFVSKLGFDNSLDESIKFEHFAAFTILTLKANGNLLKSDLESVSTSEAQGVDSVAFVINDRLVLNSEEKENFDGQSLSVDIYFIQSKTSTSFSSSEFSSFLDIVIDFFADAPQHNIPQFANAKDIYREIVLNGISVGRKQKINLHCLYVALCSEKTDDQSFAATKKTKLANLQSCNLFDEIDIELIDKATLLKNHKKAISPLRASFLFENKTQLRGIRNVEEAYIGFVPFSEFRKLIMDDEQIKLKALFNDNLRDFLGVEDNPINRGIKKTLEAGKFSEFSLLNNGITIIADSNEGKGNTLSLENYQIVNGCQTSNVLFDCKEIQNIDSVLIPLKVIITQDETLRDEIILTTNRQSQFAEEQLFGMTQFQKMLEDFYMSKKTGSQNDLYYERRTNQYANQSISRSNIIEIREQLKSFIAMFCDFPYLVAGNIGIVLRNHKDKFFQEKHDALPYYIAGLLSKKWDKLLAEKWDKLLIDGQDKTLNRYRYHIFMGFRYLVEDLPFQASYLTTPRKYKPKNARKNSFEKLLENIQDETKLRQYLENAIAVFKQVPDFDGPRYGSKKAYAKQITEDYIRLLQTYLEDNDTSTEPENTD